MKKEARGETPVAMVNSSAKMDISELCLILGEFELFFEKEKKCRKRLCLFSKLNKWSFLFGKLAKHIQTAN